MAVPVALPVGGRRGRGVVVEIGVLVILVHSSAIGVCSSPGNNSGSSNGVVVIVVVLVVRVLN